MSTNFIRVALTLFVFLSLQTFAGEPVKRKEADSALIQATNKRFFVDKVNQSSRTTDTQTLVNEKIDYVVPFETLENILLGDHDQSTGSLSSPNRKLSTAVASQSNTDQRAPWLHLPSENCDLRIRNLSPDVISIPKSSTDTPLKSQSQNNESTSLAVFLQELMSLTFEAIGNDDVKVLDSLLKRYHAIFPGAPFFDNYLLHATKLDKPKSVQFLLNSSQASDLVKPNYYGETALHFARSAPVAKILLDSPFAKMLFVANSQGKTPLDVAEESGRAEVIALLKARYVSEPQHRGETVVETIAVNNTADSPQRNSSEKEDNTTSPESQRSLVIDKKYLGISYPDLRVSETHRSPKKHDVLPIYQYRLSAPCGQSDSQEVVRSFALDRGNLILLTRENSLPQPYERVTFVRLGRNEHGFVPRELGLGRVILVMPETDVAYARGLVRSAQDVLLIKSLPRVERNNLGLAGARWLAALTAAYELNLLHFMLMDDNIESIQTTIGDISSWSEVYRHYQETARQYNCGILSSSSFRPQLVHQNLSSQIMEISDANFGYKVFFINNQILKEKVNDVAYLVPHDPHWPLQDIFFQEVARQSGLGVGKISHKNMILTRSGEKRNACAKSYKARKIDATIWSDAEIPNDVPDFYRRAYDIMKMLVDNSISFHENNREKVKRHDLAKASRHLISSVVSTISARETSTREEQSNRKSAMGKRYAPLAVSTSEKANFDVKEKMLHALRDVEHEEYQNLREPQRRALRAFEEWLTLPNETHQTYFDIATGIGKTHIMALIAKGLKRALSQANLNKRHILLITPSLELDAQTFRHRQFDGEDIIVADSNSISYQHLLTNKNFIADDAKPHIVIMCQNSLRYLLSSTESNWLLHQFALVIFDEMHLMSEDILKVTQDYSDTSKALMLGFSATPNNRKKFFSSQAAYRYTSHEGVEDGLLVPWEIREKDAHAFSDIASITANTLLYLEEIFNEANTRQQGIVWVDSIEHADELAAHLNMHLQSRDKRAASYHSKLHASLRSLLLSQMARGEIDVFIAVRTLKEGFDCPAISFAIIAKNKITIDNFIQMRGRLLRIANDKKHAVIYLAQDAIIDQARYETEITYHPQSTHHVANCDANGDNVAYHDDEQQLDSHNWKIVPFPLGVSLTQAAHFADRLYRQDHLMNNFETIYQGIYQDQEPRVMRERLRNKDNYRAQGTKIERLYYHYFIDHGSDNSNNPMPPTRLYRESYDATTGKLIYQLVRSEPGEDDTRPTINILVKKREAVNNKTKNVVMIDHYDLLTNFSQRSVW